MIEVSCIYLCNLWETDLHTNCIDGLSFSGLEWTFQLLPSKHTETITWSCSMIKLQACWSLTGNC